VGFPIELPRITEVFITHYEDRLPRPHINTTKSYSHVSTGYSQGYSQELTLWVGGT
jgi:hypothetical protein